MSKEEIINAIADIDKQLEEMRKVYEPYVGREFDSFSTDERERIRKFIILVQELITAKADLRNKAVHEYGIFVMY